MTNDFFVRVSEQLRAQRLALLDWLGGVPPAERDIRLGPQPPNALDDHVRVLEDAITRADAGELGL